MSKQTHRNRQANHDPFVHVLLFECRECGSPMTVAMTADARNLEAAEGRMLELQCLNCDWSGESAGFAAKRHWVEKWRQ